MLKNKQMVRFGAFPYEREVIVRASGLVEKHFADGRDWTEYPCLYDDYSVGYDRPEVFSKKEKRFIASKLKQLKESNINAF